MPTVSATDLARNTREILDRVFSQGETVAIERNNTLIAQIMPPQRTMTAAQALAGLSQPTLTVQQGTAWLHDSKDSDHQADETGDAVGNAVRDPWA